MGDKLGEKIFNGPILRTGVWLGPAGGLVAVIGELRFHTSLDVAAGAGALDIPGLCNVILTATSGPNDRGVWVCLEIAVGVFGGGVASVGVVGTSKLNSRPLSDPSGDGKTFITV